MVASKKTNKKSKSHPHSSPEKDSSSKSWRPRKIVVDEPLDATNLDDELGLDANMPVEAGLDLSQPDSDLLVEDVLEEKQPEIAAELSGDPVRLYLREIGQIKLLNSDDEFRIATIIEARRLVGMFRRHQ